MSHALAAVTRLIRTDEGQDLLEYGLLMALVAIGALLTVRGVGEVIDQLWWGPIARAF